MWGSIKLGFRPSHHEQRFGLCMVTYERTSRPSHDQESKTMSFLCRKVVTCPAPTPFTTIIIRYPNSSALFTSYKTSKPKRYMWVGTSYSTNRHLGTQSTQLHPTQLKPSSTHMRRRMIDWGSHQRRVQSQPSWVDHKSLQVPKHIVAEFETGQRKGQNAWVQRLSWKWIDSLIR